MRNCFVGNKASASRKRALGNRYVGMKYLIEGEYLNIEEMAARLGVCFDTAKARHARAVKAPGPVTWAELEKPT